MIHQIPNPEIKKIDCIIYTKDRACQLNLLLRSIRDKFLNVGTVYIIYDHSTEEYAKGYERALMREQYDLSMVSMREGNFQQDTTNIIENMQTPHFLGLCDDDCFIKEVDCSDIIHRLSEPGTSAVSLKGGLNIIGNYPGRLASLPGFLSVDPYLKWNWREYSTEKPDIDWGYPTCVNSYIFDRHYFLGLIRHFAFQYPPNLEGGLNTVRHLFKPIMYSFKESVLLNIVANRIQTLSPNPFATTHHYGIEELNNRFLDGERISTDNLYGTLMEMGNEEREFIFERQ